MKNIGDSNKAIVFTYKPIKVNKTSTNHKLCPNPTYKVINNLINNL